VIARKSPSGPAINVLGGPPIVQNGPSGAAFTVDWSTGFFQEVEATVTGAAIDVRTLLPEGESCILLLQVRQDETGSRAPTLPFVYTASGTPLAFSTAPGAYDIVWLVADGRGQVSGTFFAKNLQ